ncbi:HIT domain-containing protein [Maribellus comscasis]|uniref:HIT domain-containing protein n=1 Tax=Maribellus comscasis TaxID=2681766 RepID=A0A6I6JRZ0_9BACT|nr:HIT family protein [Maribellus comscasis]QGY45756.1 HIT domain-containing protein [Maribellus comscasis]
MKPQINNWHLTAKEREKMSFPTNWLHRNNFLKGNILDFGCGFGKDVMELRNMGYYCKGYDKYYQPEYPTEKFNTILCNYVLNVLQAKDQQRIIMEISQLLAPGGQAFFAVRRDIKYEGFRKHKIHKKTTYQCNVVLPFESLFLNEYCEIYSFSRFTDIQKESSCIFCKPSRNLKFIAESAFAYAVYDGFPVSNGHSLIIPKTHTSNYFDLTEKEQFHLLLLTNFVQTYLLKKFNPNGFNVGININMDAGQTVPHVHVHLIPRYKGDVKNPKGGVRHVIPGKGYYNQQD